MKLVRCARCGVSNRLATAALRRAPICGNCHGRLPEPAHIRVARTVIAYKYWVILAMVVTVPIAFDQARLQFKSASTAPMPRARPSPPVPLAAPPAAPPAQFTLPGVTIIQPVAESYPAIAVDQGVMFRIAGRELVAPFRVVTPGGIENYYLKLVDAGTGATAMAAFIHSGETFETNVPLGAFRVRYAIGTVWYGTDHLFGAGTRYREADKTFEFAVIGSQVNGYTVELIRQPKGNLHTRDIAGTDF